MLIAAIIVALLVIVALLIFLAARAKVSLLGMVVSLLGMVVSLLGMVVGGLALYWLFAPTHSPLQFLSSSVSTRAVLGYCVGGAALIFISSLGIAAFQHEATGNQQLERFRKGVSRLGSHVFAFAYGGGLYLLIGAELRPDADRNTFIREKVLDSLACAAIVSVGSALMSTLAVDPDSKVWGPIAVHSDWKKDNARWPVFARTVMWLSVFVCFAGFITFCAAAAAQTWIFDSVAIGWFWKGVGSAAFVGLLLVLGILQSPGRWLS